MEYTTTGIIVDGEEISKETLLIEINTLRAKGMGVLIIKWEGGRVMDEIKEQIIVKQSDYKDIRAFLVGTEIHFGEIAGKHSKICGDIEENDISISLTVKTVCDFMMKNPSGRLFHHSFLNAIEEQISEEEERLKEFNRLFEL